ncbi:MAG TPA: CPBP family intramembrane metalloprotease [Epulopiscium sp.]|nr:CPBP family intramembrane metalloprotease [Candidatus Epulonipiscium sp.]
MENETMENGIVERKRVLVKIGFALFAMVLAVIVVQLILGALISQVAPGMENSPWFIGILIGIPFYCVGFPIFLGMMKKVPDGPKGETKKMSLGHLIVMFFICMAAVYIFNIVGLAINAIIGLIKGANVLNPLMEVLDSSGMIATIIFVGILSPIIEEVVFRGVLLNKLRGYGDKTAIWFTALTFALFHGNLSQFFYAFVLGLFFGYIAIKTNTIRYTVILHIVINMLGSVMMPALALSGNDILIGISGLFIIIMFIVGIILFIVNVKKVKLEAEETEIDPEIRKKLTYWNVGMLLYYAACLLLFVFAVIA